MRSYLLTDERRQEIREKSQRVEPHAHSFYSLLDGETTPEDLVKTTLEKNMPAASISDHGVMYSLVDLVNLSNKHKQKYLIAMEAYVVRSHIIKTKAESSKEDGNGREHLLLIAMNNEGYKNLMRLASIAATEGFYYRPRIDDELLKKYNEGLIATSACLGSRFSQLIMRGDVEGAKRELKKYQKLFNGRFYLEIQPTKEYLQKIVNHQLIKLGKELGIPLLATSDAHYLNREDARAHDVLLTMQSNDTLNNPLRWQFPGDTFFIASRQEMFDLFFEDCESELDEQLANRPEIEWKLNPNDEVFEREIIGINKKTGAQEIITKKFIRFKHELPADIIEDAMDNSIEIADRCQAEVNFDKVYLPKVAIPENPEFEAWHAKKGGKKEENYLRYLCIKGLKDRGLTAPIYRERLEHELNVINGMGFPDYFLLLEDVISWCAKNDIPVGPGRGCFLPGQKVTTLEHGLVNIEKVKEGDHVLTHRKVFKPVKGVQQYEIDEKIAKATFVDNEGTYSSIKATEDHEIFVIPKEMGLDFKLAKWMPIGELKKGDVLLKPIGKDTPDCHHKDHKEKCVHCNGKPVSEEYDEAMRQFHETAMNTSRVIEKAISSLTKKVDDEKSNELTSIQESFEEMRDAFGFDLTIERTFEEASQELIDLGFVPVTIESVEFEHYTGSVYDLSVNGVSSYTVNGVAVHNSAAGSLVSYALGITNVDPIEYGLLFERFLNPKRGKLPDIDIDFCIKNRGRVMSYIMEKHGREHTANIATFGRLQTKAVIKDVAKAMAIPFEEVNAFTKLLPSGPGASIHVHEIKDNPEFSFFVNKYPDLFEYAAKLEGSPRHVSQHAAGMVVSPPEHPLWSLIPIQKGKEVIEGVEAGYLTQLEKGAVEELGLNYKIV